MNKTASKRAGRVQNGPFVMVFVIFICLNFSQTMLYNAVPLYLGSIGNGASITGLLTLVLTLFAMVTRIYGGWLCDHIGKRYVLIFGFLLFAASTLPYGFTTSLVLLVILRGLHGVGFGAINTATLVAGSDLVSKDELVKGMSWLYVSQTCGMAFSASIVMWLIAKSGFSAGFLGASFFLVAGAILSYFIRYEKKKPCAEKRSVTPKWSELFELRALPVCIVTFALTVSISGVMSYTLTFAEQAGIPNASLFFIVSSSVMLIANLSLPKILEKLGNGIVAVSCLIIGSMGFVLMGIFPSSEMLILCAVCYGGCCGALWPFLNALALKNIPPERKGAANGTYMFSMDLGQGLGSLFWGFIIDIAQYRVYFIGEGIGLAVTLVLFILFQRGAFKRNGVSSG